MPDTVTCPRCSRTVPWTDQEWDSLLNCCRQCATERFGIPPKAVPPHPATAPATDAVGTLESPDSKGTKTSNDTSGQSLFLTLIGLACIAVGLYYLVLHPSNPGEYGDSDTVTLHRLVLGQTATLAGVVFCAAAWRPR